MTDLPDRESLAQKAITHAQKPGGAWLMARWCGRHLATEDLLELIQYLDELALEQRRREQAFERAAAEERRLRLVDVDKTDDGE